MLYTLYWTLIVYAVFHVCAAAYGIIMQIGKGKSVWKYAWAILGVYMVVAGAQAVMAGCFVGLMLVIASFSSSHASKFWTCGNIS